MAVAGDRRWEADVNNWPRRRLARIRCVHECVEAFQKTSKLPQVLCYVPSRLECRLGDAHKYWVVPVSLHAEPSKESKKRCGVVLKPTSRLLVSGDFCCNSSGQWCRVFSISTGSEEEIFEEDHWLLLYNSKTLTDDSALFQIGPPSSLKDSFSRISHSWEDVVEDYFSLKVASKICMLPADEAAVSKLQDMPPNWTLDHDEDLAQFVNAHVDMEKDDGNIWNGVESVNVSSSHDEEAEFLTDGEADTYWESDGSHGSHWIRLKMKKYTVIRELLVTIDSNDDNYMPSHIKTMGGELNSMHLIKELKIDLSVYGVHDVCVMENQKEYLPYIEIRIQNCKDDGIDTRIHALKIKFGKGKNLGLNKDCFSAENLVRYPKLECFDPEILYRRSIVLLRFVHILDSILPFFVPKSEYSIGTFNSLENVRQLMVLSKKRTAMIQSFLKETTTSVPGHMPKLYINRRLAAEHKSDPSQDPQCKNTVFNQIFEGLKPKDRYEKVFDYRWPNSYDQWWECKFLSEGIIDQGGGFRDSLSDIAEELNPVAPDVQVPLPFFIRSPNQNQIDANINRDAYVPNPACQLKDKYEWLGKLMGACLRGKENMVLTLAAFVWKKLAGERVTWSRDYATVDESEVKIMDNLEHMSEQEFNAYFAGNLTWMTTSCNGSQISLKEGISTDKLVDYDQRHEYIGCVQNVRLGEFNKQISWLRQGLLTVIPRAVLDLLTWQELEKGICGDPEISVEALKQSANYEDLEPTDARVKRFWEALEIFSNEDRSRFLRFVTGKRRLPAPLYICADKGQMVDSLPESSTCSNTLYLPHYSSAKMAEEKLRYAAYNCIAIDTDMSPWDE